MLQNREARPIFLTWHLRFVCGKNVASSKAVVAATLRVGGRKGV
jgi:hypothetical protein